MKKCSIFIMHQGNDTEIFNRMAKIKKTEIIKCWWRYRVIVILLDCWFPVGVEIGTMRNLPVCNY